MFKVIDANSQSSEPSYGAATAALRALGGPTRRVIVEIAPGPDGSWEWLHTMHHDLEAALRGCRYLAQKSSAAYGEEGVQGQKVIASIEKHLATLERLKSDLVDPLFPVPT